MGYVERCLPCARVSVENPGLRVSGFPCPRAQAQAESAVGTAKSAVAKARAETLWASGIELELVSWGLRASGLWGIKGLVRASWLRLPRRGACAQFSVSLLGLKRLEFEVGVTCAKEVAFQHIVLPCLRSCTIELHLPVRPPPS